MRPLNKFLIWLAVILFSWLLTGCLVPSTPSIQDTSSAVYTHAVQTVSAKLTMDAGSTAVAVLTQMALPTSTPPFAGDLTPTLENGQATATPLAITPTPPASATPTSSLPCDLLGFVSDVTVPDGKEFKPGATFTKTWRIINIGSCTWTKDYALVFSGGDQMGGESVYPLTSDVPPEVLIDLSVSLTAPSEVGSYAGYWMLRNAGGVLFGGGDQADEPINVHIKVDIADTLIYDFADHYCKAQWTNSRVSLNCPTKIEEEMIGFVYTSESTRLETGNRDDEPALITHPDAGGFMRFDFLGEQGLIAGAFPAKLIEDGDHFEAVIGCLFGHEECNVLFYLLLQKPNGNYEILGSWQEYYDGELTTINVDLSAWAGKEVGLILAVVANGPSQGDYAFWLAPRLLR